MAYLRPYLTTSRDVSNNIIERSSKLALNCATRKYIGTTAVSNMRNTEKNINLLLMVLNISDLYNV
jgi:hypothetical protein